MLTLKVICCLLVVYSICRKVGHHCIGVQTMVTRTYATYCWIRKELMWTLSIGWVHVYQKYLSEQKLSIWKMCAHIHSITSNHLYCVTLWCVHLSHGCVGGCVIVPAIPPAYDLYIVSTTTCYTLLCRIPEGIWYSCCVCVCVLFCSVLFSTTATN